MQGKNVVNNIVFCLLICVITLCGCDSQPSEFADFSKVDVYGMGYENGYNDGYKDCLGDAEYDIVFSNDELNSFQVAIEELMYDHEYDTVRKFWEYNRSGVETALELGFGSKDIDSIIEYIDELSKTVRGICEICNKPVYADEFFPHRMDLPMHTAYVLGENRMTVKNLLDN